MRKIAIYGKGGIGNQQRPLIYQLLYQHSDTKSCKLDVIQKLTQQKI